MILLVLALSAAIGMAVRPGPCAVATWEFGRLGLEMCTPLLQCGRTAVEAVEIAVRAVELDTQDQYYVGVGGYPNALGKMELDAAIMDGDCRYGAVMSLPGIPTAISVARTVMEKCPHNVLTGEGAQMWAKAMGFEEAEVLTEPVRAEWTAWRAMQDGCHRDPSASEDEQHDTVGVICMDQHGRLSAGTSTSGWRYKHPGRVGDSPIVGSGLYCDNSAGAAVATGDGEEIMRTCASFLVVELMRMGVEVGEACAQAVRRVQVLRREEGTEAMHTKLVVGIVAMDRHGTIGAASSLGPGNEHRGRPYFPAPYWRAAEGHQLLLASIAGAQTPQLSIS